MCRPGRSLEFFPSARRIRDCFFFPSFNLSLPANCQFFNINGDTHRSLHTFSIARNAVPRQCCCCPARELLPLSDITGEEIRRTRSLTAVQFWATPEHDDAIAHRGKDSRGNERPSRPRGFGCDGPGHGCDGAALCISGERIVDESRLEGSGGCDQGEPRLAFVRLP